MIDRPILILGAPRSGTTLLFEILSATPGVWSIGTESGRLIERYAHPASHGWASGALRRGDLTPAIATALRREFELRAAPPGLWDRAHRARRAGRRFVSHTSGLFARHQQATKPGRVAAFARGVTAGTYGIQEAVRAWHLIRPAGGPIRFVEKTPENCLRVPFLLELFPDARVVHLVRSGPANIASLMEGWRHPTLFPGYRVPEVVRIPGDGRGRWAFTLVPGWRDLLERPLAEVCARQWIDCNEALLDSAATAEVPWITIRFEDLIAHPTHVLEAVTNLAEVAIDVDRWSAGELPIVNAVSRPNPDKWRSEPSIASIMEGIEPMMRRLGYAVPEGGASSL